MYKTNICQSDLGKIQKLQAIRFTGCGEKKKKTTKTSNGWIATIYHTEEMEVTILIHFS